VQFDGERATSVDPAPLLDEHGATIRAAMTGGAAWPGHAPAGGAPLAQSPA
jgi:hypothetical protein